MRPLRGSLFPSNDPLGKNSEPIGAGGFSSPRAEESGLHSVHQETPRHSSFPPQTHTAPGVLPLPRHLAAAAMLAIPDCAAEIGPPLPRGRNVLKGFPSGIGRAGEEIRRNRIGFGAKWGRALDGVPRGGVPLSLPCGPGLHVPRFRQEGVNVLKEICSSRRTRSR